MEIQYKNGRISQPERLLDMDGEYDVIVTGGGIAGVGAAIAAARSGCKTLLVEKETALGGLATIGLVNIPLDFLSSIGKEMYAELEKVDGLWKRNSDPEKHKLVLDRMVLKTGCSVLLDTYVVDSLMEKGRICGVVVESKAGRKAILAKRVIDCSGDADAAYYAGCDYKVGRAKDGLTQACSTEFRLGGVDWDMYHNSDFQAKNPRWVKVIRKALENGDMPYMIENHLNWMTHVPGRPQHCGKDEVSICMAHSRNCHPLDNHDLTRMYIEGREQVDILWKFIKKYVPGFENSYVIDTGTLLGVRDTRRITGEYILTGNDLANHRHFDDVIAVSRHGYDIHNPDSVGNIKFVEMEIKGEKRFVIYKKATIAATMIDFPENDVPPGGVGILCDAQGRTGDEMEFPDPVFHDIPYRCLVPLKVENLMVAGRCLSSEFEAQAGTRLIMCCMAMGEAAGIATAMSLKEGVSPRKIDVKRLQKTLLERGCDLGQEYREIKA
ncbi:MAG TPA: FAD-dependent oxidoreductase [bacterium]|nr:FAD-dependent oxidoreductase [bacterium]